MVGPDERRKITRACLLLPLYGELKRGDEVPESQESDFSYANESAQRFLREATKPCFASLRYLHRRLLRDGLPKMRRNRDEATKVYDRLKRLEKSRTRIPKNEREAFETIELKIEECLNAAVEIGRALADSTYGVGHDLADMREHLEEYDELLQCLENHEKVERYQQILSRFEKEHRDCLDHPIRKLDVDQKRSELLTNLCDKRWREHERYRPTRADVMEAIAMGW